MEEDAEETKAKKEKSSLSGYKITNNSISKWEDHIEKGEDLIIVFKDLEQALLAAIESLGDHDFKEATSKFKVEGHQMFNAVVRICLQNGHVLLQKN